MLLWWCIDAPPRQAFEHLPALASQCDAVVLDVLEPFMLDLQEALRGSKAFLDELFAVLSALLTVERPTPAHGRAQVVLCVFETLRLFVHTFSAQLFVSADSSSYCGDLAFLILQYCNVAHGPVRAGAAALLYLLMRTNFRVRGNFARMKLQTTIAVSKLQVALALFRCCCCCHHTHPHTLRLPPRPRWRCSRPRARRVWRRRWTRWRDERRTSSAA